MLSLSELLPNGPILELSGDTMIYNGTHMQVDDASSKILDDFYARPENFIVVQDRHFTALVLSFAHLYCPFARFFIKAITDFASSASFPELVHQGTSLFFSGAVSCLLAVVSHHFELSEDVTSLLEALEESDTPQLYSLENAHSLFRIGLADACRAGMKTIDKEVRQIGAELVIGGFQRAMCKNGAHNYEPNYESTHESKHKLYKVFGGAVLSILARETDAYLSPSRGNYVLDCITMLSITEFNMLLQSLVDCVLEQPNELFEGCLASLLESFERQGVDYFNTITETILVELAFHPSHKIRTGVLRGLFFTPVTLLMTAAERICDVNTMVRSAACEAMAFGALRVIPAEESGISDVTSSSSGNNNNNSSNSSINNNQVLGDTESPQKKERTPHEWYVKAARTLACMLMDSVSLVRKAACKGLVSLLQQNPWGPSINATELKLLYSIVNKKYNRRQSLKYEDKIDLAVSFVNTVADGLDHISASERTVASKQLRVVSSAMRFAKVYEECLNLIRSHLVSAQISDAEVLVFIETCIEFKVCGSLTALCDVIALASTMSSGNESLDMKALLCVFQVVFRYSSEVTDEKAFTNAVVNRIVLLYQYIIDNYPTEAYARHDQLDKVITILLTMTSKSTLKTTIPPTLQDLLDFSHVTNARKHMVEKLITGLLNDSDVVKYVSVRLLNVFSAVNNRFLILSTNTVVRVITIFVGALLSSKNVLFLKELGKVTQSMLSVAFTGSISEPILLTVQNHGDNIKNAFLHLLETVTNYIINNQFLCFTEFVSILTLGGKVYIDNLSKALISANTAEHLVAYTSLYAELSGLLFTEYVRRMGSDAVKNMLVTSGSIFNAGAGAANAYSYDDIMEEYPEIYVAADVTVNLLTILFDAYDAGLIDVVRGSVFYSILLNLGRFCSTLPLNFKIKDPKTGNRRFFVELALLFFVKTMKLPREHTDLPHPAQFTAYKSLISCVMTNSSVFTTKFAIEQLFYPLQLNDWPEFQATGLVHLSQLISADYLKPDANILLALRLTNSPDDKVASIASLLLDVINKKQPNPLRSHISELIATLMTNLNTITEKEYEYLVKHLIDAVVDTTMTITLAKSIVQIADRHHANETLIRRVTYCITYLDCKVVSKASAATASEFRSVVSNFMDWLKPEFRDLIAFTNEAQDQEYQAGKSTRATTRRNTGKTSRRSTAGLLNLSELEGSDHDGDDTY